MDGQMSRLPSSVTSIANPPTPGAVRPFPATQSLRDLSTSFGSPFSIPPTPSLGVDPPRPAKEGCEWVWFPGGYWAERERVEIPRHTTRNFKWRKKSGRNSSSRETGETDSTFQSSPKVLEPTIEAASLAPLASPWLSEEAHVASLQQPEFGSREQNEPSPTSFPWAKTAALANGAHSSTQSLSPFSPVSGSGSPQLALSGIGNQRDLGWDFVLSQARSAREKDPKDLEAYTEDIIEGAKQRLAHPGTHTSPLSRISTLLREESSKSPNSRTWQRKLFGKSPWHRKASTGSDASATSSILEVLRGHTPLSTPVSETTAYVETPREYCEEFPGGEATRVDTPPLRESTDERPGRSFFFDISQHPSPDKHLRSPLRHQQAAPPSRTPTVHRATESGSQKGEMRHHSGGSTMSSKEWWEVPISVPRWEDMRASRTFEFELPEHLPNSPMCPANKNHQSGGTGVCVYHGRRKKSTPLVWGEMVNHKTDQAWEARNIRRESEG
ncbi:hypothetical protein PG994_000488 [Apiospora phragmitis]|uniref:Uncharacterized protein n=1 Tax=Apiospora phragmitis TaxID=2905665 RepID=A0ABR1X6D1_9PEZI